MTGQDLDGLAQVLAVTDAPALALAVHERRTEQIAEILGPMTRQELLALAVVLADQIGKPRTRFNDGVIDEIAVARVIAGEDRPLTVPERREAVRRMAARGATQSEIARVLHMSGERVRDLLDRLRAETDAA